MRSDFFKEASCFQCVNQAKEKGINHHGVADRKFLINSIQSLLSRQKNLTEEATIASIHVLADAMKDTLLPMTKVSSSKQRKDLSKALQGLAKGFTTNRELWILMQVLSAGLVSCFSETDAVKTVRKSRLRVNALKRLLALYDANIYEKKVGLSETSACASEAQLAIAKLYVALALEPGRDPAEKIRYFSSAEIWLDLALKTKVNLKQVFMLKLKMYKHGFLKKDIKPRLNIIQSGLEKLHENLEKNSVEKVEVGYLLSKSWWLLYQKSFTGSQAEGYLEVSLKWLKTSKNLLLKQTGYEQELADLFSLDDPALPVWASRQQLILSKINRALKETKEECELEASDFFPPLSLSARA